MTTDSSLQRTETLRNISNYFDGYSEPWKQPYTSPASAWNEYHPIQLREDYAIEFIAGEPKGMAVDLGCGIGHALIRMKQVGFDRVVGIDISPNMLADAGRLLEGAGLGAAVELYRGDVRDLTMIGSGTVDACTALGVIEYHPEDGPMLKEVNRILKPNGVAVIQTRNFYCVDRRTWRIVQRLIPRYRRKIVFREHRPTRFRAEVPALGFRIERECFSHFYALYPLTAIPLVQKVVAPVNNYLSKKLEAFRGRPGSMFLAATYMAKLRKVADVT